MPRVCEHCGSDTYKAENFDRVRDSLTKYRERCENLARRNGLLQVRLEISGADAVEERAGLQRKVNRQARVIRRLEDRLRKLGRKPHEGVSPGETSPVMQADEAAPGA